MPVWFSDNPGQNKVEQLSPIPPPKQWWRREGAKTRHFGIIELAGRGGPGVPFILSKIVATVKQTVLMKNLSLMLNSESVVKVNYCTAIVSGIQCANSKRLKIAGYLSDKMLNFDSQMTNPYQCNVSMPVVILWPIIIIIIIIIIMSLLPKDKSTLSFVTLYYTQ